MTAGDLLASELRGLSCYTGCLASYLAGDGVDAAALLAHSIRLAIRIDLPDGALAFSHHRVGLNRLPDGTELAYATGPASTAVGRIADELATTGRVIVVVDNAQLHWSPSYRHGPSAPHWLLVDDRRGDEWHVLDPFSGLLPSGEQQPFAGWLTSHELLGAMRVPPAWTPAQHRRNELAFGLPVPVPAGIGVSWLHRTARSTDSALPGRWLLSYAETLPFLGGYLSARLDQSELVSDDIWAIAQHQAFRHRWLAGQGDPERPGGSVPPGGSARPAGDPERQLAAADAWTAVPQALRFAVESASRGRPRTGLLLATLDNLLVLEAS